MRPLGSKGNQEKNEVSLHFIPFWRFLLAKKRRKMPP